MRIRTIIGRTALGALALALIALAALAVVGVPRPPTITTRHVPRLHWRSALQLVGVVRELGASLGSPGWPVARGGLWISTGRPPQTRYRALRAPGQPGTPLSALPGSAWQLVGSEDTLSPVVVFARDEGGSERSRLYGWTPGRDSVLALTPPFGRLSLCCVNASGSLVAFGSGRAESGASDILVANARHPEEPRTLMAGVPGDAFPVAWSPDGRHLLILELVTFSRSVAFVADAQTGQVERLVPAWGDTVGVVGGIWSRDGKRLFLVADAGSEFAGVQEVTLASRRIRQLTPDLHHDVSDLQRIGGSDSLEITVNEDGVSHLYGLDTCSGRLTPLPTASGYLLGVQADPASARLAEVVLQPDGRRAVYVLDLQAATLTRWALGAPPPRAPLPSAELSTYPTFDSAAGLPRRIDVILRRPPAEFKPPWPVLINLHGGPTEQAGPTPDPRWAAFRRIGIAVLEPNVRGSTGFGKTFAGLDDGRRREDAVRDVGALLDWIATRPELDASRVAVIGGSYGGYLSLATLVHFGERLRCGIDLFGISDLASFLEESEHGHFPEVQRAEFGDERDPRMRAFLDSISPVTHADRIHVPVLIYQGANDPRVEPAESRRMVSRLETLGRTVWYIEASNEGHGLDDPLNQLYVGTVTLDFLKRYLLPGR